MTSKEPLLADDDLDHGLVKSQVLEARGSINRQSLSDNMEIEEDQLIVKGRPDETMRETFLPG
jgi:hypothetical protein